MAAMFPSYWIVSIPGDPNKSQAFQKLDETLKAKGLTTNYRFDIPELKVGTLDSLMQISDELGKHDLFGESTVAKVASNLSVLLDRDPKALETSLQANGVSITNYLQQFQWNEAKFPTKNSIKDLVDSVVKQLSDIDNEMKSKMTAYNNQKTNLTNMERKQTGNLLIRSLTDIVKKEHFVLNSEFLTTLLVVVPRHAYKDWYASYESELGQNVVPRSSEKIEEDKDYGLFTVTLFRKFVDDFKAAARERKFVVRDFEFKEEEIESERNERTQLSAELQKQLANMKRWCKTNFSEAFEALVHLKALRTFVESVLRYGLPPNFVAALLQLNPKNEKKIRTTLKQLYGHLGASSDEKEDESSPLPQSGEYHPYVSFNVNLESIR